MMDCHAKLTHAECGVSFKEAQALVGNGYKMRRIGWNDKRKRIFLLDGVISVAYAEKFAPVFHTPTYTPSEQYTPDETDLKSIDWWVA